MQHRPLHILLILEATIGGTREHIRQIMHGLDPARFRVSLLCSAGRSDSVWADIRQLRAEGFAVHVVSMRREIRPLADLRAFLRIVAHLRRHRYDIVHTHSSKAGFLGRFAAWFCGVPRIYHTPHVYFFQWRPYTLTGVFFRAVERLAAQVTTRTIAVSESQRRIAVRCGVVRPHRIVLIENGVAIERFHPDPELRAIKRRELGIADNELLVGMVGRLEKQKGCRHFLFAARLVLDRVPRARFLLAGEGEFRDRLAAMARELGLGDRFLFLGHRDDVPELYPAMDLFVLTSLWEGMPYVVLEAMAAGKAVVATSVPGTLDLVEHGVTGFLAPPEDDAAIAERVKLLLTHASLREEMGRRGRRMVRRRFTRRRFIARLSRLYETGDIE